MVTHNTSTSLQGSLSLPIRGCNGSLCSNMEIFTLNITRVVWPHVTNLLDLRYFCQHNPLFYHLNLIPCHYWSWQRNIYFLVNIFVRHTFSTSKSSIKTKTVLTMTDMTESTELLAFERQKDGYKGMSTKRRPKTEDRRPKTEDQRPKNEDPNFFVRIRHGQLKNQAKAFLTCLTNRS